MNKDEGSGGRSVTDRLVTGASDANLWRKIRAALPKHHTIPDPEVINNTLEKSDPNRQAISVPLGTIGSVVSLLGRRIFFR